MLYLTIFQLSFIINSVSAEKGITDRVVRTEIGLKFINECRKIPHPMHTVGWVHETGLKPVDSGSLEIRKNEKDCFLIRREHTGTVSEV